MKLSCGITIINSKGQVLGCKPHDRPHPYYDIPKGEKDEGETPYECALRETLEETGLDLSGVELTDCGEFDYMINKRVHIYKCFYDVDDLTSLQCTSKYYNNKKLEFCPEISGYRWVEKDDINNVFYPKLSPILNTII